MFLFAFKILARIVIYNLFSQAASLALIVYGIKNLSRVWASSNASQGANNGLS